MASVFLIIFTDEGELDRFDPLLSNYFDTTDELIKFLKEELGIEAEVVIDEDENTVDNSSELLIITIAKLENQAGMNWHVSILLPTYRNSTLPTQ